MKKARIARQNQRKGREGEGKSGGRILGARNAVGEMSGFMFYLFALAQEPQHQKFFSLPLFRLKLSPQETSTIAAGSLRRIHPPAAGAWHLREQGHQEDWKEGRLAPTAFLSSGNRQQDRRA